MRKKSRMFAIAEALRARRTGVTAAELAQRFNVTLRTIYRDLDALQDAGMPIRADRRRGGGYALDKNYQLPPDNFAVRQAAVPIALWPCSTASISNPTRIASAGSIASRARACSDGRTMNM